MVETICFISFSFHYDPLALLQEGQVRETIGIKNLKGRLIESHVKYSTARGATPSSTLSAVVSYSRSNNSVSLGKLSNWSREKFLYNFLRNNGIKEAVVVL